MSDLCLHAGGQLVSLEQLRELKSPPAEGRWHPIAHGTVLETVKSTLQEAGEVLSIVVDADFIRRRPLA